MEAKEENSAIPQAMPKTNKTYIAIAIAIFAVIAAYYAYQYLIVAAPSPTTTSLPTTSITTTTSTIYTTIPTNTLEQCANFTVTIPANKTSASAACFWSGGNLTLRSIEGPNSTLGYTIKSFNSTNTTYVSSFIQYNGSCMGEAPSRFFDKGSYLVQIHIYGQANSLQCNQPSLKLS